MGKRILVPIVGQGSVMSIIRTGLLDELKKICEPVIVFSWHQHDLFEELRQRGFEVYLMPELKLSVEYSELRKKINFWFQEFRLKSVSTKVVRNYLKQFHPFSRRLIDLAWRRWNYFKFMVNKKKIAQLIANENDLLRKEKSFTEYKNWLDQIKADAVYTVTPFLLQCELIGRILREQNGKLLAAIHSFDNITKRPWSPIHFDNYSVWNKYNKAELLRIFPTLAAESIQVNGAPQFDFHFNPSYRITREEWKQLIGLKDDAKIILYAGGWHGLTPNEWQYLRDLAEAVRGNRFSQKAVVLFRMHPLDKKERWKELLNSYPEIYLDVIKQGDVKADQANVTDIDISRFCSTLAYSDVHINLASTMAIDGCAFNKPQIGPYYDNIVAEKQLRGYYHQEHYLPIINVNGVYLANSKEDFIISVERALCDPQNFNSHSQAALKEIITYTDGNTTHRIFNFIKRGLS